MPAKSQKKSAMSGKKPHKSVGKSSRNKSKMLKEKNPLTSSGKSVMQVNAPVATAAVTRRAVTKPVPIERSEEVSDLRTFAAFTNTSLIINPGNQELFPWLSSIASAFTSYYFEYLRFRYVPATETGLGGDVVLAVNADPDKPPFISEKAALNQEGSAMAAPWVPFAINGKLPTTKNVIPEKFVTDIHSQDGLATIFDDLHTVADGVLNVVTAGLNLFSVSSEVKDRIRSLVKDGSVTVKDEKSLSVDPTDIVTGKLWVDYKVWLSDPVEEQEAVDDGYNFGQTPTTSATPNFFGYSALSTTEPVFQTSSLWSSPSIAPTVEDACKIQVTNTTPGTSFLNFKNPGLYTIEVSSILNDSHYEMKDAGGYCPSITTNEDMAVILTNTNFGSGGSRNYFALEGSALAADKKTLAPTGAYKAFDTVWWVEIKGDPVEAYGQVSIFDPSSSAVDPSHIDADNSYIAITRVDDNVTASKLKAFAKKSLPMSLPDCPLNAAITYLRREMLSDKTLRLNKIVSSQFKRDLRRKPASKPKTDLGPVKTGYFKSVVEPTDEKSALAKSK